jgi:polyisoprenoid-binding protein YceI
MSTTNDSDSAALPRLGRYAIDTDHSSITFKTRHFLGLLPVKGTFAIRSGTIEVAEPLAESSLRVEVDAAGFHTGNALRDTQVRSAKFLDTGRHPLITFVADRVETTMISGVLTVCGVAKPERLAVVRSEVFPETFTVRATTRVDRYDFGVTASRLMTGRHFDLTLEVTCVHR